MNIIFEYQDENDIIINSKNGVILFSNYYENDDVKCPVPFAKNPYNKFRPDDTVELALDGNLYYVSYYHNGFIMEIEK